MKKCEIYGQGYGRLKGVAILVVALISAFAVEQIRAEASSTKKLVASHDANVAAAWMGLPPGESSVDIEGLEAVRGRGTDWRAPLVERKAIAVILWDEKTGDGRGSGDLNHAESYGTNNAQNTHVTVKLQ